MSRLSLVKDSKFQEHKTPDSHPESPQRLAAIDRVFKASPLAESVTLLEPKEASEEDIAIVHDHGYIEQLKQKATRAEKEQMLLALDGDTFMSPKTYQTAKLAAGAGLVGIEAVNSGAGDSAFIAVRPPGHHALSDTPMGFCLFNNIAVAAKQAQKKFGAKKVLIIDWDVHHGNGTQAMFYDDPTVLFTSFHQYPFWPPDSGWYTEDGSGDAKGYNLNIPLPKGTGDRGYMAAFDRLFKPVCQEFEPDLILLSAGYDAHELDPLAQQRISTLGFTMLSQRLADLRDQTGAKLVCFLEGGYNTKSLSESAVATMRVLNAETPEQSAEVHVAYTIPGAITGAAPVTNDQSSHAVDERIEDIRKHFTRYWKSLK